MALSNKTCGSICLAVRAKNTGMVVLDFFVLNGPNNLLGRLALEQLWPLQYKALRDIATEVPVIASKVVCNKGSKGDQHQQQQQRQQVLVSSTSEHAPKTPVQWVNPGKEDGDGKFRLAPVTQSSHPMNLENFPEALPKKRELPAFPDGDVTQEEGEAFCRLICETYPEVFDGKKGSFVGQKLRCTSKMVIWSS